MTQPLENEKDPLVGQTLANQYVVESLIARGGMGNIYLGRQARLGRTVAIKVLRREFCEDGKVVKRFIREALAVGQLRHPHTAQVFDSGETPDGIHFIVMEYLEGESLDRKLVREQVLDPQTALSLVGQAAAALGEAHAKGIVHRDLKPANIFVVSSPGVPDFAKVLDFGIAKFYASGNAGGEFTKLTAAGSTMGTPHYMAPEQIRGEEVDATADIYSLAIILWECLGGHPPFEGNSPMEVFLGHLERKIPKLAKHAPGPVPDGLDQILSTALAKKARDRFQNMAQFKMAVDSLLGIDPAQRRPQPMAPSPEQRMPGMVPRRNTLSNIAVRKRRLLLVLFALAAVAVVSTLAVVVVNLNSSPNQTPPAEEKKENSYTLKIDSHPQGASIFVDNALVGKTPVILERDNPKTVQVELSIEKYQSASFKMTPTKNSPEGVLVSLPAQEEPPTFKGDVSLWIESEPAGAAIIKDGQPTGFVTPYMLEVLVNGDTPIQLRLERKGFLTETHTLIPRADTSLVLSSTLVPD